MRMAQRDFRIRPMTKADYPQARAIYEQGLDSGHASFETSGPTWEEFAQKKLLKTCFVAVEEDDDEKVLGWVSGAPASSRSVYYGVVENSIYVGTDAVGRGIAGALMDTLIDVCNSLHYWSLHAWIFPENEGSKRLHESRGFERVGTMHHMGRMTYGELKGQWRNVDLYERLLDKPEDYDPDNHTHETLDRLDHDDTEA